MRLTISNEITGQLYGPVELSDDTDLADLVALLELDCQFDSSKNDIYHQTNILDIKHDSERSVEDIGLKDNDLLLIRNKFNHGPQNLFPIGSQSNTNLTDEQYVEQFRHELQRNQPLRQQLTEQIPGLNETIENPQTFSESLGPSILQRRYPNMLNYPQTNPFNIPQQEYQKLMDNPDLPENKKRIAELIDQQVIDEQLRNAYEYTPEVFTTVTMLYINLEINGTPVKAFVDTGAQMTIMSTGLAERTGLTKLIDKRFIGEARGVGVGQIIGRIHQALVKIETQFIPSSFVVLDTQIDLLIGLDMLKRHQACVDLRRNVLKIADIETAFLGEADIPKEFESANLSESNTSSNNWKPNETNNLKNIPVPQIMDSSRTSLSGPPPQNNQQFGNNSSNSNIPQTYPPKVVQQLMDLGFSRAEVIKALNMTGGNPEFAASLLFQ
ncbi:similar to Saccharomyces cerevisiae YER143W DDI1 DNA damage-inducible v-SNARE binding protein with a role in suppression of protein secretion [Maudiozyma barnettii]|uniref:DNA damage-inducible protein 1 n=1 Tax=Maudiozyma barnettii TaxID=61262 RepID=A0A8H2ZJ12_9SACH|nr:Ddi1p [Kazachstania barnettii]CAB4255528.1 similar to Saccharomyces cerevisiae YER143W DDI1 DNA damage-inducible v-SNARE binding protein with a role in suppression of protein secretion [Kazachstania barnettii]CAD1784027.1 similar to Saccharomyces cerevisiae YER143W DDI1 DNA damage-inducible v-SNARE binding protein with a role in suppression of protein secretion [Kazachstania barnettii]